MQNPSKCTSFAPDWMFVLLGVSDIWNIVWFGILARNHHLGDFSLIEKLLVAS